MVRISLCQEIGLNSLRKDIGQILKLWATMAPSQTQVVVPSSTLREPADKLQGTTNADPPDVNRSVTPSA